MTTRIIDFYHLLIQGIEFNTPAERREELGDCEHLESAIRGIPENKSFVLFANSSTDEEIRIGRSYVGLQYPLSATCGELYELGVESLTVSRFLTTLVQDLLVGIETRGVDSVSASFTKDGKSRSLEIKTKECLIQEDLQNSLEIIGACKEVLIAATGIVEFLLVNHPRSFVIRLMQSVADAAFADVDSPTVFTHTSVQ